MVFGLFNLFVRIALKPHFRLFTFVSLLHSVEEEAFVGVRVVIALEAFDHLADG